jgi:hypothetical protein
MVSGMPACEQADAVVFNMGAGGASTGMDAAQKIRRPDMYYVYMSQVSLILPIPFLLPISSSNPMKTGIAYALG